MRMHQVLRDSLSMMLIARAVMFVCIAQITLVQCLPLMSIRSLNAVARGIAYLFTHDGALILSLAVAVGLLFSFINRGSLKFGAVLYTSYTLIVAYGTFRFDVYVGFAYVAYSILGLVLIAALWRGKDE